jgi:DNA-binding XRE family transcriptional regulator
MVRRVKKTDFPSDMEVSESSVLGASIRASRTEASLSLEEAAMTLGIAKQTLADLERGKPTVSLGTVLKVVRELGLTLFIVRNCDKDRVLISLKKETHHAD